MHQEEQENQDSYDVCKIFKLTNGETIIALVSKETLSYVEVTMPYKLATVNLSSGRSHLVAQEWDTSINSDVPIRVFKTGIVAVAEPNEVIMKSFSNMNDTTSFEEEPQETKEEFYESLLKSFKSDKIQ
jgi:hypothetical protein